LRKTIEKIKTKNRTVYDVICTNMVESDRHIWQQNRAHALCMLDN